MKVTFLPDGRYRFGESNFDSVLRLKKHFEIEKPIVGGESGIITSYSKYTCTSVNNMTYMYVTCTRVSETRGKYFGKS